MIHTHQARYLVTYSVSVCILFAALYLLLSVPTFEIDSDEKTKKMHACSSQILLLMVLQSES